MGVFVGGAGRAREVRSHWPVALNKGGETQRFVALFVHQIEGMVRSGSPCASAVRLVPAAEVQWLEIVLILVL